MLYSVDVRSVPSAVPRRRSSCTAATTGGSTSRTARYLAEHIDGARLVELPGAADSAVRGRSDRPRGRGRRVPHRIASGRGLRQRARDRPLHRPRRFDRPRRPRSVIAVWSQRDRPARADRAVRARTVPGPRDQDDGRRVPRGVRRPGACDPVRGVDPRRARRIGLDVRAGLHTGEIELRGDDIAGMAVNIGARIAAIGETRPDPRFAHGEGSRCRVGDRLRGMRRLHAQRRSRRVASLRGRAVTGRGSVRSGRRTP